MFVLMGSCPNSTTLAEYLSFDKNRALVSLFNRKSAEANILSLPFRLFFNRQEFEFF